MTEDGSSPRLLSNAGFLSKQRAKKIESNCKRDYSAMTHGSSNRSHDVSAKQTKRPRTSCPSAADSVDHIPTQESTEPMHLPLSQPNTVRAEWTDAEVEMLAACINETPKNSQNHFNWKGIAKSLSFRSGVTKTNDQCKAKFQELQKRSFPGCETSADRAEILFHRRTLSAEEKQEEASLIMAYSESISSNPSVLPLIENISSNAEPNSSVLPLIHPQTQNSTVIEVNNGVVHRTGNFSKQEDDILYEVRKSVGSSRCRWRSLQVKFNNIVDQRLNSDSKLEGLGHRDSRQLEERWGTIRIRYPSF